MDPTIGKLADRALDLDPLQRRQALSEARHRASAEALQSARDAQDRKAEQRQALRAILEEAVGANTRLLISRAEGFEAFVYRAVDRDSGEVVKEWPPAQFAAMLNDHSAFEQLSDAAIYGLVVDEQI